MRKSLLHTLLTLVVVTVCQSRAQNTNVSALEAKDAAYTRTLNERAGKIVAPLGLADVAKSNRVHRIIVQQYRDLGDIHHVRDVQIENARAKAGGDKSAATVAIQAARHAAKPKLDQLHGEFLARLSAELSPGQVDQVKDGMTYGVLPLTYGVYLRMYPELTEAQKLQIKLYLTEARELAMDGSTSEEKHAVFGKYKGKINNYLSKAGYDAKKGEANLKKVSQSPSQSTPQ
jgi:hypothetical protein